MKTAKSFFFLFIGLVLPTLVFAEGSSEIPANQGLQNFTQLGIYILDHTTETITWTGTGTLTIRDPGNAIVATLNTGQTYDPVVNGIFSGQLSANQVDGFSNGTAWDITVNNAPAGKGRVYSTAWGFNSNSLLNLLDGSFYAVVPGGDASNSGVIELKMKGLSGFGFTVFANQSGVDGVNAGRSVPVGGNSVTATKLKLFINPPDPTGNVITNYTALNPTSDGFSFAGAGGATNGMVCIDPGVTTGNFSFNTNVVGRYKIVCDLNHDGVYDLSGTEFLLSGATASGANSVSWNGQNRDGADVSTGHYDCKVIVSTGELHYIGSDIETVYEGMRMFELDSSANRAGLPMFWNDSLVQASEVDMPCGVSCPNGSKGLETSGPNGILSGNYADAESPNVNARSWGDFSAFSKGNNAYMDTFAALKSTASTGFSLQLIDATGDTDGDGLQDIDECVLGTHVDEADSDGDGASDYVETNGGSSIDTDGDGIIDALDLDSDGDGCTDALEITSGTNRISDADSDGDGLTDCQEIGTYHTDPQNPDTDGGGVSDGVEVLSAHTDPLVASDDNLTSSVTCPSNVDTDGDGMTDCEEIAKGLNPALAGDVSIQGSGTKGLFGVGCGATSGSGSGALFVLALIGILALKRVRLGENR